MVLWGRIPVARCEYQLLCVALVGLKPTDGRVRRHGFTPLSWSLVHVRALTRTVRDTALLLSIISGYDPHDPATSWLPVPDYVASLTGNVAGPRVGIPRAFFFKGLDADVQQALEQAIQHLKALGVQISGVSWSSIGRVPGLDAISWAEGCLLYTSPSPRDGLLSRMPSSA